MTATKECLKKLQLLQNVCCRIILLAENRTHLLDMHKDLQLMFLEDRRNIHLGELCHKNIYGDHPMSLAKYLTRATGADGRVTRYSNYGNMVVPRCRTVAGGKAFYIRGPKFWNTLENLSKTAENFKEFARRLRSQIDQTYDNHPT